MFCGRSPLSLRCLFAGFRQFGSIAGVLTAIAFFIALLKSRFIAIVVSAIKMDGAVCIRPKHQLQSDKIHASHFIVIIRHPGKKKRIVSCLEFPLMKWYSSLALITHIFHRLIDSNISNQRKFHSHFFF